MLGKKQARQSSTEFGGDASRALDGNTNSNYSQQSITHTKFENQPWWEVDLGRTEQVGLVRLYNRGDGELSKRLSDFDVILYDEKGTEVARQYVSRLEGSSLDLQLNGKFRSPCSHFNCVKKISSTVLQKVRSFSICS